MSLSVGNNTALNNVNPDSLVNKVSTASTVQIPAYKMSSDSVKLSSVTSTNTNQPVTIEAGGWKKFSNALGQMGSSIADALGFGETYNLIRQEFNQVDMNRTGNLQIYEFNMATLNVTDFWGIEFGRADKNRNGSVDKGEYVDYRKQQLTYCFERKDISKDNHLNINEIGVIGQQLLANRDTRLDANQDGLVNKREFIRSVVRGTMNIREFLGF
jgi:hypothetical protein